MQPRDTAERYRESRERESRDSSRLRLRQTRARLVRLPFLSPQALGKRVQMERRLIGTSATLIIVPSSLLEHWHEQLCR